MHRATERGYRRLTSRRRAANMDGGMQHDRRGFTLIELLVVVAILGILAAVAIFAVGNLTDKSGDNACATEASTVETASEAYQATQGTVSTLLELKGANGNLKTAPTHNIGTPDGYTYHETAVTGFAAGDVERGANCGA